ncbi:hypothetical protein HanIR_Chr11g0502801 [Helianthus annuus]|nr:hypothetical protein HanIR_Chr11g0502801 [Helianthus annuus]
MLFDEITCLYLYQQFDVNFFSVGLILVYDHDLFNSRRIFSSLHFNVQSLDRSQNEPNACIHHFG